MNDLGIKLRNRVGVRYRILRKVSSGVRLRVMVWVMVWVRVRVRLEEVFVFDIKSENRDRAVEAVS